MSARHPSPERAADLTHVPYSMSHAGTRGDSTPPDSKPEGLAEHRPGWSDSEILCKPNPMKLASIGEAQPRLSKPRYRCPPAIQALKGRQTSHRSLTQCLMQGRVETQPRPTASPKGWQNTGRGGATAKPRYRCPPAIQALKGRQTSHMSLTQCLMQGRVAAQPHPSPLHC